MITEFPPRPEPVRRGSAQRFVERHRWRVDIDDLALAQAPGNLTGLGGCDRPTSDVLANSISRLQFWLEYGG